MKPDQTHALYNGPIPCRLYTYGVPDERERTAGVTPTHSDPKPLRAAASGMFENRLRKNPELMLTRRSLVEHPFGTMKSWAGSTPLLTRRLAGVSTEMSLQVLAYNMKRATIYV